MLKKRFRLTKRDNISNIIKEGKSLSGKFFLCKAVPNELKFNRFSIVVSKKVEKRAVRRNKCRRRIHEALRNHSLKLNSDKNHFDVVLLVNRNCIDTPYNEIEAEVKNIKL
ncbi:ribonuclease P protein component [Candidatus Peregrinibacteria bacterium]|jgi:ribonuclease P protein component|nr:ribonuclease P protein component [Candidatus Peregrinibacteria bacterium]